MSRIIELIKAHLPHIETQQELDEAYLAESVDIYDLEHRMRDLDIAHSCMSGFNPHPGLLPFPNAH